MKKGYILLTDKWRKIGRLQNSLTLNSNDKIVTKSLEEAKIQLPDFFLQNGMKKPIRKNNDTYIFAEQQLKEKNIPILIRENCLIRSLNKGIHKRDFDNFYIRLSWNSFFADEGLFPYDSTYDRWNYLQKTFNIKVKDFKSRGDNILICLQEDQDAALNRLQYNGIAYPDYMVEVIKKIKKISDRKIIVRAHPQNDYVKNYLQRHLVDQSNIEWSKQKEVKPLEEDLNNAHCVVVYNSTSSVESILEGLPTIVLDSSGAASEVAMHSLEDIENRFKEKDRSSWLKKIAFQNWKGDELKDGYVWKLLKKLIW